MANESKSIFAQVMSINAGRISFVLTILGMVVCFICAYVIPQGKTNMMVSMISGITSVVACQQFIRVLTAVRMTSKKEE